MVEASRCSPQQKAVGDAQYTNPYECVLATGKAFTMRNKLDLYPSQSYHYKSSSELVVLLLS